MCIFQKFKIEYYTERLQLWPIYQENEQETEAARRRRMFIERTERRQENKELNKRKNPIQWDREPAKELRERKKPEYHE